MKKLKLSWPRNRAKPQKAEEQFEPEFPLNDDYDLTEVPSDGSRRRLRSVYDDEKSITHGSHPLDEGRTFKFGDLWSGIGRSIKSALPKSKIKHPRTPESELSQIEPEPIKTPAAPKKPMRKSKKSAQFEDENGWLVAQNLAKSFRRRPVVRDVTLAVRQGEAVGLLGPNGAGKTTVFYMITGLIRPDKGAIRIDGFDVTSLPMYTRARLGIGYLPQEASIFRGLSVEDNIKAVLEIVEPDRRQRKEDLERLLEEFGIGHLRKSPSIALSGGERRRCEIARALASRPAFMLLDEPFAGIDPIAVGDIQQLVRQLTARGIGVLITDHNVRETLGLIDRAYIIHSGEVLMEGTPEDIVQNEDVRRVYLGDQFTL